MISTRDHKEENIRRIRRKMERPRDCKAKNGGRVETGQERIRKTFSQIEECCLGSVSFLLVCKRPSMRARSSDVQPLILQHLVP
jgi:hypothetical protein